MSDIGTDTREIAARMMPWDSPPTYTSKEVPDWELLRVHALRLADAFHGVRDRWQETGSQLAAAIEGIVELETDLETMTRTAAHQGDLLDQAQAEVGRLRRVATAAHKIDRIGYAMIGGTEYGEWNDAVLELKDALSASKKGNG